MNKLKINILGLNYSINTQEDEDEVQKIVDEINSQAKNLVDDSRISVYDAIVLCLLEYADRYRKAEESADNLRNQLASYIEDASRARIEVDECHRELERLNREVAILQKLTSKTPDTFREDENGEAEEKKAQE